MSDGSEQATAAPTTERICPECEERSTQLVCQLCNLKTIPTSALVQEADPLLGQILAGQYKIVDVLGQGGMGTVYRGTQVSIDRTVAIKLISKEFSTDLESIKRFQREAKITSKLTHPNTIRLYDFGLTDDGLPYLVMELLEGRELADELAESGRVSLGRAVEVCVQVLRALEDAHGLGIVHRDLKPANIFMQTMGSTDMPKVMDFGIAKTFTDSELSKVTKTGMLVGTPAYMSPEQVRGEKIGPAADIYAVGTIFYELLAGRVPFEADTPVATLLMQLTRPPPPIGRLRPDLPHVDAIQGVLNELLAKRSDQRPATARAAAELLLELTREGGGKAAANEEEETATMLFDVVDAAALAPPASAAVTARKAMERAPTAVVERPGPVTESTPADDVIEAVAPTPEPPAKSKLPIALGLGATVVVAAGAIFAMSSDPAPPEAVAEPAAPAEVEVAKTAPAVNEPAPEAPAAKVEAAAAEAEGKAAAPAPAAEPVKAQILSTPTGASVFAGGRPLGTTPLTMTSPVAGSRLELELSAKGYKTAKVTVEGGHAGELAVVLEKVAAKARPAPRPRRARTRHRKRKGKTEPFMLE